MKLIIIQLSDMHCGPSADAHTIKIDKAVQAITSLGKFDRAIVVFSGDLTNTAAENEYRAAKQVMGRFLSKLGEKLGSFIRLLIVPGNHDIVLPKGCRDAKEIESWNLDEHLSEETDRMNNFFKYATSKKCFRKNRLFSTGIVDCNGVKIQFCLLNSAPYSTLSHDDKQFHHFPSYVEDKLTRMPDVDLKITVMHHHFEWCEWYTKEMLKQAISTDDVTFFGHDHKAEALSTKYADGISFNIIMGGKFDLRADQDSAFNAVTYDSDTMQIQRYEFNWIADERLFIPKGCGTIEKRTYNLSPANDYINELLKDPLNISKSYIDYYVLPKLIDESSSFSENETPARIKTDDIFTALEKNRALRITGLHGAGKTALLRYLYKKAADRGLIPLLIERRAYTDSRIDKMFRNLFDEQYKLPIEHGYESYLQADNSKKIVFIDDADQITNQHARKKLISNIIDSGMAVVFTTTDKNQDIEEIVKDKLQGKSAGTIDILPIYKETRDALIDEIGLIYKKSAEDLNAIKAVLDYVAQCQSGFFTFTPASTLQYIKYFMQHGAREHKGVQTISMVFETNIRNSILDYVSDIEANIYLAALEYIADIMYFDWRETEIDTTKLAKAISEFNRQRKANIDPKVFLSNCNNSCILKDGQTPFCVCFYDNNTYVYFVAKSLNREFERNRTNRDKLNYVMQHICFGINDTIILFLSFIRSNTAIILEIAAKAVELVKDYPEWEYNEKNIPFLHENMKMSNSLPTESEKKVAKENVERVEQGRHEAIKFRGIFDFNEADVEKTRFLIIRAYKYIQLVGRALVDQYGSLDADEIDQIVDALYTVPPRIVYAMLTPAQLHYEETVQSLLLFAKEFLPDKPVTEEMIRELLSQAGIECALDILNDVAFNASNSTTISALRSGPVAVPTHQVFELMMEENVGNTSVFVDRAVKLFKDFDGSPYGRMLIYLVARKHLIYTGSINHKSIDELISGGVFSKDNKPSILIANKRGFSN